MTTDEIAATALGEMRGVYGKSPDRNKPSIRLEPGTTKNKDGRDVEMTEDIATLLSACIVGKKSDDYVFTRKDGRPVRSIRNTWQNTCVRVGLGNVVCPRCQSNKIAGRKCPRCKETKSRYAGLVFHDLRRTAARNLRRTGVPEGVIMKIGGWKTRSIFERYAIVNRADMADAIRKLELTEKSLRKTALVTIGHETGHAAKQTQMQALPVLRTNLLPH